MGLPGFHPPRLPHHPRSELRDKCKDLKITQSGTLHQLKERLFCHQMERLTTADLSWQAAEEPAPPAEASSSAAPAVGKPEQEKDAAAEGNGQEGQGSELVLFGRSTFTMEMNESNDKTEFFQDMGPDVETAGPSKSYLDLIQEGEHGVIPVAAMIKVMQGFQEVADGANQVALLFSGSVFVKKNKWFLILMFGFQVLPNRSERGDSVCLQVPCQAKKFGPRRK